MRRKLSWTERYRLGIEMSKHLEPVCSYEVIAAAIGTTKQNAYTEVMLALGSLAFGLQRKFNVEECR